MLYVDQMLIQIDMIDEFEWMGIKIDRYNLAHCTKYYILQTPKHLPLLPPPAMKPAVWPVGAS
jgi:hypothetical protein